MARLKLATTWLGGCSGCHMSFLDMDEWLLELGAMADIVYSPIVDAKEFPAEVDVTLIEGAVANEDHVHHVKLIRARSRVIVSFGDCAVTGNVTALRNSLQTAEPCLRRSYEELAATHPGIPREKEILPVLCDWVRPVHQVVPVDFYIPGCPPPAPRIRAVLESLAAGKAPHLDQRDLKFG